MPDSAKDILNRNREAPEKEPVIHSIVFGYGHRMRCGKDLACSIILRERGISPLVFNGYSIKQYSFAKALKQEVTRMALGSGACRTYSQTG